MRNLVFVVVASLCPYGHAQTGTPAVAQIRPGTFMMGADAAPLGASIVNGFGVMSTRPSHGDFDELPAHSVKISRPFAIGVTEVTEAQFRAFDPTYRQGVSAEARSSSAEPHGKAEGGNPIIAVFDGYAAGVSWKQAMDYCAWLSKKTGKPWRLPTEAEWEYVARAGGNAAFGNTDQPAAVDSPNSWGVKNMGVGRPEWVLDWYGPYSAAAEVDPVGPSEGTFKVVRGGGLDYRRSKPGQIVPAQAPYFARAANRASMAPTFHSLDGNIGFRVVQAPLPPAKKTAARSMFFETAVKQSGLRGDKDSINHLDPAKPWYHTRELFPNLQGKSMPAVGWKLGLARGLGINYHNSAIQQLPNGDWLAAYYNTPDREDDPDQTVLIMRRRAGSEEWDMPEPWPDFADAANAAPVIWNESATEKTPSPHGNVWLFWGFPRLIGAGPFAYVRSSDNGATWSQVEFPYFPQKIGRYVSQPINSVVRVTSAPDAGTILLPTDSTGRDADGNGSVSAVWGTRDEGKTWFDTGGRTAGRHTTLVVGSDGKTLLGFGGKNSNVDGRMPLATSTDGGKTWRKSKTPFDQLLSGERPSVIRLRSGRLFFVADYNPANQKHIHKDGAYVALSDDDGAHWVTRKLPANVLTVGYTTATQGSDGIIHVVTSKNKPDFEIELNEAWINDQGAGEPSSVSGGREPAQLESFSESYRNGGKLASWGVARDSYGRYLLDGAETFWYPNGKVMWSMQYALGHKVGEESFYRPDGSRMWQKLHNANGEWVWKQFDAAGQQTAESKWNEKTLLSSDVPDPVADKAPAKDKLPQPEGM